MQGSEAIKKRKFAINRYQYREYKNDTDTLYFLTLNIKPIQTPFMVEMFPAGILKTNNIPGIWIK